MCEKHKISHVKFYTFIISIRFKTNLIKILYLLQEITKQKVNAFNEIDEPGALRTNSQHCL